MYCIVIPPVGNGSQPADKQVDDEVNNEKPNKVRSNPSIAYTNSAYAVVGV